MRSFAVVVVLVGHRVEDAEGLLPPPDRLQRLAEHHARLEVEPVDLDRGGGRRRLQPLHHLTEAAAHQVEPRSEHQRLVPVVAAQRGLRGAQVPALEGEPDGGAVVGAGRARGERDE
ncbi:MAG TPA: hypothetical protein PK095_14455, partial [Myxococcota bacterium]|nr:hypothetical protein [Myxococcota bacterium]